MLKLCLRFECLIKDPSTYIKADPCIGYIVPPSQSTGSKQMADVALKRYILNVVIQLFRLGLPQR